MYKYTIVNHADKPMRIFAENEQRALDIAMDARHAFKEDNLTVTFIVKAPDEYHEGVASCRILDETLNVHTLQMELVGDPEKCGWYGGPKQQPKIGDPEWD